MSGDPAAPRFYLRNCHAVTRPYRWCPLFVLVAELFDLAPEVYADAGLSAPLAGLWLVENNVALTYGKVDPADAEDTLGVLHLDIDIEIRRREKGRR